MFALVKNNFLSFISENYFPYTKLNHINMKNPQRQIACLCVVAAVFLMSLPSFAQTWTGNTVEFNHSTMGGNYDYTAIYRADTQVDRTHLRIRMGDEPTSDFDIGYIDYQSGQWVSTLMLDGYGTTFLKGNLGIGITNPMSSTYNEGVQINKGHHSSILLSDPVNTGYGGIIQTSDAKHRVFIGANLYDDAANSWKNFQSNKGGAGISIIADQGVWGTAIDFYTSPNNNEVLQRMTINSNGNVGIGTSNPGSFKLAVNGKIWSQEVNVAMTNPGPDYVFENGYNLLPLAEIEKYIQQYRHLPEVPSAEQMEAEGLNLKEMNLLLLKKIEELTLHLIEKEKQLQDLEERVKQVEKH
jgi:hypothetical protein